MRLSLSVLLLNLAATQLALAQQRPAQAEIQYIDASHAKPGSLVEVKWAQWWGQSAQTWQLIQNGSQVCGGRLTHTATTSSVEQKASCSVYLHAGENQFLARLCNENTANSTLESCSESKPYKVTLPTYTVSQAKPWNPSAIYSAGDQVVDNGVVYQAKYWVQYSKPGANDAWIAIANQNLSQTKSKISDWKHAATAAYSVLFDDYCAWANDAGLAIGESELRKRGLIGSFGVIAGFCGEQHWPELSRHITRGHEVFNHSWDHGHPLDANWASRKWGGNELEIKQSTEKISNMLGGYTAHLFGFPFDAAADDQLSYLKSFPNYLGTRAPNYWQTNGVNEKNFSDPFRVRFQVYANADQTSENPASLSNLLSTALSQQGWAVRVFHSVHDS